MIFYYTRHSTENASYRWKQILKIENEKVTILHLKPALLGWNFDLFETQSGEHWEGMSAKDILVFKDLDAYARESSPEDRAYFEMKCNSETQKAHP